MLTKRTTRTAATLAAAVLTVGLSACSASSPDDAKGGGPTEIVFSYLWGGTHSEILGSLVKDFNASQDKIVVKGVSNPDTTAQLTAMSSPKGSFDVSDNFSSNTTPWASRGILEPLDAAIKVNDVDVKDFIPAAVDTMKYDGKIYQMPIAVQTYKLLYNKKLFDEAGLKPPTSMEEFAAVSKELTKVDESGNLTQVGYAVRNPGDELFILGFASGGQFEDKNGPTPLDPKLVEGLEFYQKNFVTGIGADKLATFQSGWGQYTSPEDPFFQGKVAMVLDGEYMSYHIGLKAPEGFEWGVADLPVAAGVPSDTTYMLVSTLFIPRNAPHKEEAGVFLSYLLSNTAMETFTTGITNLPARMSLASSPDLSKITNFDPFLKSIQSPNIKTLQSRPYSQQYKSDMVAAFDEIRRGASTVEDALAKVDAAASSYQK